MKLAFDVPLRARKAGALGIPTEFKTYTVDALSVWQASCQAVRMAHADGLEHAEVDFHSIKPRNA
jgi:hypothetical protein